MERLSLNSYECFLARMATGYLHDKPEQQAFMLSQARAAQMRDRAMGKDVCSDPNVDRYLSKRRNLQKNLANNGEVFKTKGEKE